MTAHCALPDPRASQVRRMAARAGRAGRAQLPLPTRTSRLGLLAVTPACKVGQASLGHRKSTCSASGGCHGTSSYLSLKVPKETE